MKTKDQFPTISEWTEYVGNYAEAKFSEECAKRGYTVLTTTSVKPYDFVVEKYQKDFNRVQIKALSKVDNKRFRFRARGLQISTPLYKADAFDTLAMYLVDYDRFYYIPSHIMIDKLNDGVYIVDTEIESTKIRRAFDVKNYKDW